MILYSQEESWITNLVLLQLLGFHLILQLVRRFSTAVLGPSSWRSADAEAGASNGVDDIYIALAVGAHGWGAVKPSAGTGGWQLLRVWMVSLASANFAKMDSSWMFIRHAHCCGQ